MDDWYGKSLNMIFTRMRKSVKDELGTKYPNIDFTRSNINKITRFPSVQFEELAGNEKGMDLDGTTINAVDSNIQIRVFYDKNQDGARDVMSACIKAMKKMRYAVKMPTFENETTMYCCVTRVSRVLGSGDKL